MHSLDQVRVGSALVETFDSVSFADWKVLQRLAVNASVSFEDSEREHFSAHDVCVVANV